MGFSTRLGISGNPEFEVNLKAAPLDFQLGGEASLALSSGPISGHVEQIPLRVRVPFMKANHGYVVAASIGPFGVHLHEINATVRAFGVEVGGVLGKDGIDCDMAGVVRCCMEVDVNGKLPAKLVEAAVKAVFEE
jgi:hypothetical protein